MSDTEASRPVTCKGSQTGLSYEEAALFELEPQKFDPQAPANLMLPLHTKRGFDACFNDRIEDYSTFWVSAVRYVCFILLLSFEILYVTM